VSGIFGDLAGWAADVIEALGYVGLAMMVALENVFPPIPSEVVLPLAGFLSGQGRMWLPGAVLAATVGSVVGALVLYWIGHWFGDERLRTLVRRHGRWLGVQERDLDRANRWFDRHDGAAVFICRLVPVVRSLVSIPAGIRRMPLTPFLLYTALGSGLWNTALIGLGWLMGDNWEEIERYVGFFQYVVLLAAVLAVGWFLWKRKVAGQLRRMRG